MFDRHESPSRVSVLVSVTTSPRSQHALDTIRTDDLYLHIASPRMCDPHANSNMLQRLQIMLVHHLLRDSDRALQSSRNNEFPSTHIPVLIARPFRDLNCRNLQPRLWLDKFPVLRRGDELVAIERPEAILVRERTSGGGVFPVWILRVDLICRTNAEMLDVAPCEVGSEEYDRISR